MTKNRLQLIVALAIGALLLVGGFFLGVQPQLAATAENREQRQTIDTTNDKYRTELGRLAAQSAKLPTMQREAAALEKSIPASASTSTFYKEVDGVAASTGVTVAGITTSWAEAYTPPATQASPGGAPTDAATTAPTATPSPAPTPPAVPAPVTDAQITASNFSTISISIDVTGSFAQALAFTSGVQNGDRLFLVNDIKSERAETTDATATATDSGATTWTLSGYIYVLSDAVSAKNSQASEQVSDTAPTTSTNG